MVGFVNYVLDSRNTRLKSQDKQILLSRRSMVISFDRIPGIVFFFWKNDFGIRSYLNQNSVFFKEKCPMKISSLE